MNIIFQALKAFALVTLPLTMTVAMEEKEIVNEEDEKDKKPNTTRSNSNEISFSLENDKEDKNFIPKTTEKPIERNKAFFIGKIKEGGLSSDSEDDTASPSKQVLISSTKTKRVYDLSSIKKHAEEAMQRNNSSLQKDRGKQNIYQTVCQLCDAWGGEGLKWLNHNSKYTYIKKMALNLKSSEKDIVQQITEYISSNAIDEKDEVADILPKALDYIKEKLDPNRKK